MANIKKGYIESQKKKRHKARVRRLTIIVIASVVVLVGAGVYVLSDRFYIVDVSVDGVVRTPREDVDLYLAEWLGQKKWGILPVRSYWLLSRDKLASGLASAFPTIERAEVATEFPRALKVTIKEYSGWGVLCRTSDEGCFWIDRAGVAFEAAPAGFSGTIVPKITDERERTVVLKEQQLSSEMMRLITFFNEKAPEDPRIQSVEFTIARTDETIRIKTRAGWEILVLEKTSPEYVWSNLDTALVGDIKDNISRLEYIDLRFGNKLFYKLRE
ncbi:MAG: FtsQ-type POTRA domain-containing protein [Candidatus Ryanbacteria bacterium]|nr:FtsQ-type POTRA domain-containing protein [Candidatus Ryanbacteria bacterium]